MAFQKAECPDCGGNLVPSGYSNQFICESCKQQLISDDKAFKVKGGSDLLKKFSYEERKDGLLNLQITQSVTSISQVINILERVYFPPKDVYQLIISDNNISSLSGIEKFENLESLYLKNNNIEEIDLDITEFLTQRIYRSKEFSLNVTGNKKLVYGFLNDLKIEDELPQNEWSYISIPEIENKIKGLKKQIKDAERRWERSESSNDLQHKYKTFEIFLTAETIIPSSEMEIYQHFNNNVKNNKNLLRNRFTLYADRSPFDFGIKDFFELEETIFYKYINYPLDENVLINSLTERTGYDFGILQAKQRKLVQTKLEIDQKENQRTWEIDQKEKRKKSIGNSIAFTIGIIGAALIIALAISIISELVGCVKSCNKELKNGPFR